MIVENPVHATKFATTNLAAHRREECRSHLDERSILAGRLSTSVTAPHVPAVKLGPKPWTMPATEPVRNDKLAPTEDFYEMARSNNWILYQSQTLKQHGPQRLSDA
jgi:hypothetical protein